MQLTESQLLTLMTNALWPFFRIAALCMVVPVFGNQMLPMRIRMLFAVLVSVAIVPTLDHTLTIDPLSIPGVAVILQQVLLGIMMGFVFVMVMQAFIVSAQIISMQSGLGFASLIDPSGGGSVPLIGQFYLLLATLLFLSLNGHLAVVEMVSQSFKTFPIGTTFPVDHLWALVKFLSWTFQAAIYVSLPVIISLLVINVSFAVLTRAAPQINIFSIGFPITLAMSLLLVYLNLSGFNFHFELSIEKGFEMMSNMSRQ